EERAVVTNNIKDFRPLAVERIADGRDHAGLILLPATRSRSRNAVGALADAIEAVMRAHPEGISSAEHWIALSEGAGTERAARASATRSPPAWSDPRLRRSGRCRERSVRAVNSPFGVPGGDAIVIGDACPQSAHSDTRTDPAEDGPCIRLARIRSVAGCEAIFEVVFGV